VIGAQHNVSDGFHVKELAAHTHSTWKSI